MPGPGQNSPKTVKYRLHQPSQQPMGSKSAENQPCAVAQTQIPAADAEAQIQPGSEDTEKKYGIGSSRKFWPQGPQKFIPKSQPHSQQTGGGKMPRGQSRLDHPSRRRSQPPLAALGSS